MHLKMFCLSLQEEAASEIQKQPKYKKTALYCNMILFLKVAHLTFCFGCKPVTVEQSRFGCTVKPPL